MFWSLSALIGVVALAVWVRFVVSYIDGGGKGHVQSLILGAVLFIAAVVLFALGVIGDLLAAQRVMTQKTFERVRRIELELKIAPSHYESGALPAANRGNDEPNPAEDTEHAQPRQSAPADQGQPATGRAGTEEHEAVRL